MRSAGGIPFRTMTELHQPGSVVKNPVWLNEELLLRSWKYNKGNISNNRHETQTMIQRCVKRKACFNLQGYHAVDMHNE